MAVTRGLDILVYVGDLVVGGQKNCTLSMEAETIDISNKEDFGWASFIGGAKNWSVSCDGQFIADNEGQTQLMEAFTNATNVKIEMKNADESVYFSGQAQITSIEIEASFDDVATLSIEFTGVGELKLEKGEL